MGARKPSFSTLKTRLLGEKPGNASASTRPEDSEPPADDSQQHMSSSSSGASLAPPDRRRERTASSSSRNNGIFGVASAGRSTDDLSLSQAQRQGTSSTFVQARSAESQDIASIDGKPRYGVSIPSQRRWIGYWARVLALNDPRAVLRSHMPRERRQVTIVRISVDRIVHLKGNGVQKLSGPMAERETREEDDNAPAWTRTTSAGRRASRPASCSGSCRIRTASACMSGGTTIRSSSGSRAGSAPHGSETRRTARRTRAPLRTSLRMARSRG